jgi:GNAT superfamily N-acetyltransferase
MDFTFKPLNEKTWHNLETLFGEKGACGGCWCMTWRLTQKEYEQSKGNGNKRKFFNAAKEGKPLGVIAYHNKIPIGWCSVSPRTSLVRLETSRLFKKADSIPVWSITCLFIKKEFRRKGISSKLIQQAASYAFKNGALAVESYPVIPKKKDMPDVFAYIGTSGAFMKAGFKTISQPSETRLIMRLGKQNGSAV